MNACSRPAGQIGLWSSLVALALGAALSCAPMARQAPAPAANAGARLLAEGELALVVSRLGTAPRRVVTASTRVPLRVYFDPGLVDLRKVETATVWGLDRDGSSWTKLGTASPEEMPMVLEPQEGVLGLRASVTYRDGTEKLLPRRGEPPALWLCVDRSPPALVWLEPLEGSTIRGLRKVLLKWSANEIQFGDSPARLEWSSDRGRSWKAIATLPQSTGHQSFLWSVPDEVSSDVVVRVVSQDLAGHEASATVALVYPGSIGSGEQALLSEEPIRKMAETPGEVASPVVSPVVSPVEQPSEPPSQAGAPLAAAAAGSLPAATPPESKAASGASASPGPAPLDPPMSPPSEMEAVPASPPLASAGLLQLEPLPMDHVRGGDTLAIEWRFEGTAPEVAAVVEWSVDGGLSWAALGEAPLAAGKFLWHVPAEGGSGYLLRVRTDSRDGNCLEASLPRPLAIDIDPPRLELGSVPRVAGRILEIPVAVVDPQGAGVERVDAYLRREGESEWRQLERGKARLEGGNLRLDVEAEPEGAYEVALSAVDRVGNASPPPGAGEAAVGAEGSQLARRVARVRLDHTPPAVTLRSTPLPWVAGFRAELQIEVDWADAVPPLVLEGQGGEGAWRECGRWGSVPLEQVRFGFDVPSSLDAFSVRCSVADGAGNRGLATYGPHPVESPIKLLSFTDGKTYPARGAEKIRWSLHPAAAEMEAELNVSVEHQARAGADWVELYSNQPAAGECYWELGGGDQEEHRIRLLLKRKGALLGEAVSPVFRLGGSNAVAPSVVRIEEESLFLSERARSQVERFFKTGRGAADSAPEIEALARDITSTFEKALTLDQRNYHASYGLAQFLNRSDSVKNAQAVATLLERTVEIKPDHLWALNDLGAMHIRDGTFDKAEAFLRRSVEIEASPIILYNLGLALLYNGKMAEARERLELALRSGGAGVVPEGEAYYYLVHSYLQEGNMERARSLFRDKGSMIPADLRGDLAKALGG